MPERPETYPARPLIPFLALRATRHRIVPLVAGAVHQTLAEPTR
ncbi:hypothetical protein [Paraburkholderia bryophila]|uniref:Uncharacterized protein n=1 Tax=Paraburkholderia bryophila TaxID=420952 RepID=A0A7Y9WC14_9BURK|nr:hypothetical protein [Paraburkholderia bryophila]NYH18040.1 hypothetical protein [Paraburkholderia bryophila]